MFQDKMVTPATPERVFALCKIVEKRATALSDLRQKMEPDYLNQTTVYFSDYRTAAEELNLIRSSDGMVSLAVDPKIVKTTDSMRRYINSILEEFSGGQFYLVTQKYYELGSQVLTGEQNVAQLAPVISDLIGQAVDAPAMRGWRFWMSFLGLGYLQDMFLIPNADGFLEDVISIVGLEKNRRYSFGAFIDSILPYSRMVIGAGVSNHQLNYGVSNGLRTLHDAGKIKLEHILDQNDIWSLYPFKAHPISGTVTNITICN